MIGEPHTPYEGGFFYFRIHFPPSYPKEAPKVKLVNTGGGRVRFNPNIYANGRICHTMLGTWEQEKNRWKPEFRLLDVLLVIQDMLQENPYKKEPIGYKKEFPDLPGMEKYNEVIRHETLRVAVCDMLEGQVIMPEEMRCTVKRRFREFYPCYMKTCTENTRLNGISLNDHDPFSHIVDGLVFITPIGVLPLLRMVNLNPEPREGNFDYSKIQERLHKIKEKLGEKEEEKTA
ncbi:ubiquitin-conjugating enzyme E2 Z-like isoform X2 [Liolophura sinensis]